MTLEQYRELLRITMRDYPESNKLIGDFEHKDKDIDVAIIKALGDYNSTPPPLPPEQLETFSAPGILLDGAMIELIKQAIFAKIRNQLLYNDSGFAADEDAQGNAYMQFMQIMKQEYKEKVAMYKRSKNVSKCFGGTSSEYSLIYPFTGVRGGVASI